MEGSLQTFGVTLLRSGSQCFLGIGLSEKPIIGFESVFSDIGLKSQQLDLRTK